MNLPQEPMLREPKCEAAMLESLEATDAVFSGDTSRAVPCGTVVLTPKMRADSHADALAFYQRLRD
jgi:hypothetical protein